MKTFSVFLESWLSKQRKEHDQLGPMDMPSDKQRPQSSFEYDPPPEHDALHNTYNKEKYKSAQSNPKGSGASHVLNAYKAVEKEHGGEGLKKLMHDHKQPGFRGADTDEAQNTLKKKVS